MIFPKYPEYKDSGVEWLGEVPAHWRVAALKRSTRLLTEKTEARTHPVALENIESWSGRFIDTESEFQGDGVGFIRGDILFGKLRPYLAKVLLAKIDGEAVGDFHVIRPASQVLPSYLAHYFRNRDFISIVDGSTYGAKMPRASWDFMGMMPTLTPPVPEQKAIAAFLDHETARIDALVEEQQRLIELLKEKRQAVISHAVTKGLDPDVPMKDSGVEWLGEVPAHWVRTRLKNVSPSITVGIVVNPSSYLREDGLPYIYGGEIREGFIDVKKARKISYKDSLKNIKTILQMGDVVTMRVGYPGVTAVVPPECEGGNCASVMLIKKGGYNSMWLCAVMNSRLIRHQVELVQYGAAQKQFNISDAIEFWLFEPPFDEQVRIADFIDRESLKFDRLVCEAERNMGLLMERRSALISAAVTGKIDVRGWQADQQSKQPEILMAAETRATYG